MQFVFGILFLFPVSIALVLSFLPAFGWLPKIQRDFTLEFASQLFNYPGFWQSLYLTLKTTWLSTIIALAVAIGIVVSFWETKSLQSLNRWLSVTLSIPHAAFAISVILLFAPSGWLIKSISPWLTSWQYPPLFSIVKHPSGIGLIAVLVLKEIPFFVLMILSQLNQIPVRRTIDSALSLGYSRHVVWLKVLLPQIIPRIRLAVFIVLSFAISIVDITIIIGPNTPSTLAVVLDDLFSHPDLSNRFVASFGTLVLFTVAVLSMLFWYVVERFVINMRWSFWVNGVRQRVSYFWCAIFFSMTFRVSALIFIFALLVLLVWSFTFRWQFPDILPHEFSLRNWSISWEALKEPLLSTIFLALASTLFSTFFVIALLEKMSHRIEYLTKLIYFPLLIPQISLVFGLQVGFLWFDINGFYWALCWVHCLYVMPYIYLTLKDAYMSYDKRYTQHALSLGISRLAVFGLVKLPILLRSILVSFAIGMSVSISLYLPTLYIGEGRFDTLAMEVVNVASGSDTRRIAVYVLYQYLLVLAIYAIALTLPNFKGFSKLLVRV